MNSKTEILAPAGSIEQLVSAVNNGCDSVYLGLNQFNARLKAPNFTVENLPQWVDYCHLYGVKVYVTLNTSLKNDEFDSAVKMLQAVYESNADGVIVTDTALMKFASKLPKPFEVVASTQLNVHDKYGAEFVKSCGATTVVCARECSLRQIREIASVGIKTECFVHGATCVCQSGQCLFSAMVGGNSGNRGLCAQPCRKLYSLNGGGRYYLLSARDLSGLDSAKKLYEAGVEVFKIEGRNRRAEYAGATSRVYRKLFDNDFRYDERDKNLLAETYNRDMAQLSYLDGDNSDIVSPLCQNHAGVAVGTVCGNAVKTVVPITKGDGFKIFCNGREVCGGIATASGTGLVPAELGKGARNGMEVRRTSSVAICEDIRSKRRVLSAKLYFYAQPDQPILAKAKCNTTEVQICGEIAPAAQNKPTSASEIERQLKKSGNSPFDVAEVTSEVGNVFLAKSQINSVRRNLLDKLQRAIVEEYNSSLRTARKVDLKEILQLNKPSEKQCTPKVAIICYNECELARARELSDTVVYKPDVLDKQAVLSALRNGTFLDLPAFADMNFWEKLLADNRAPLVCHNVGHVQLARKLNLPYIAGSGLNIYNDRMAEQFADAVTFVYSQELTVGEISQFSDKSGLIFADGNITLMKFVHCPYKLQAQIKGKTLSCAQCAQNQPLRYRDEMGNEFCVLRRKDSRCTFELVNGKKLSAIKRLDCPGRYLVDFDERVVKHYVSLNNGIADGYAENAPYTKGRLFDKVN